MNIALRQVSPEASPLGGGLIRWELSHQFNGENWILPF